MDSNFQKILTVLLDELPSDKYVFFGGLCDYYHIDTEVNVDIDIFIDEVLYDQYIKKILLKKLDIFTDIKPAYREVKCNAFNQLLGKPDILYGNNCDIIYGNQEYRVDITIIKNIGLYQKNYGVMISDQALNRNFWIQSPKTRYNNLNKLLLLKEQVDSNPRHTKYSWFYRNDGKKFKTITEKIQKYRDKYEW